jgi:DNA-binding XRE family transcriptional regulator
MTEIYDQYTVVIRMTPAQCRAARELLGWTADDLANAAGVSAFTIRNFEQGRPAPDSTTMTLMQRAFEGAGVRFQEPMGDDPGVRLANRPTVVSGCFPPRLCD